MFPYSVIVIAGLLENLWEHIASVSAIISLRTRLRQVMTFVTSCTEYF